MGGEGKRRQWGMRGESMEGKGNGRGRKKETAKGDSVVYQRRDRE